ncbi:MAG: DUF4974 domain-containing protein [Chitinophagales bacterium]|nr:DUF4974 domain-containing protein [Chitinophagales bacterium]
MSNQRLTYLFARYVQGQCDAAEKRELSALALSLQNETELQQLLERYWIEVKGEVVLPEEKTKELLVLILHGEAPVVSMEPRFRIKHWWAVAAVVLLLAVGGWFFLVRGPGDKSGVGGPETEVVADVSAPEVSKARVTLSDGRIVSLDSLQNGLLANQSGVELIKQADGKIVYQYTGPSSPDPGPLFNTLTNPRGSKVIDITLSDGTRVWLNAGSSLRYPASFAASPLDRKVEITGEAYFEVAHDKTKPFYVSKGDMEVMVLGTHFNVNAYDDEADIRVTLLEGRVKVSRSARNEAKDAAASKESPRTPREIVLAPGQQALLTSHDSRLTLIASPDIAQALAWKNGITAFRNADIQTIMRQLSRWYDVEIVYEDNIPTRIFTGEVSRDAKLSEVFKILELSEIHFRIEGKRVVVTK